MSSLISIAAACLAIWLLWKVQHLLRLSPLDSIAGPPATSLLRGHVTFSDNTREFLTELVKKYGGVVKLKFFFGETILLVSDPKALHSIIVKDQHIYAEPAAFLTSSRVLYGPGLLATTGEQHRKQKKILNPVFATSHVREMTPIFYDVVHKLKDIFANKVKEGPQEIELLEWISRTALEVIGQSGFGYSFDDLSEGCIPHTFPASFKRLDEAMKNLFLPQFYLLPTLSRIGTRKFQSFVVRNLPWKIMQEIVQSVDIIYNTSVDIIKSRKLALEAGKEGMDKHVGRGKDIISLLLRANEEAKTQDRLSDEEVIAQISILTFAAMDSTTSALARTLWILAVHQDAQDKLRLEIREACKDQENPPYDALMNLPYLDAVCKETLRLYPPFAALSRVTRQDMVLPLRTPIKGTDGRQIHEIPIPKGTRMVVNIAGCNNDPETWGDDCCEWKPERWFQSLPDAVSSARVPGVFSNMMTFLGGGRACIGFKFAVLEMKVVLLLLINSFRFSLPPDKEIYWQTQGIGQPAIVGFSDNQLPLVVEQMV